MYKSSSDPLQSHYDASCYGFWFFFDTKKNLLVAMDLAIVDCFHVDHIRERMLPFPDDKKYPVKKKWEGYVEKEEDSEEHTGDGEEDSEEEENSEENTDEEEGNSEENTNEEEEDSKEHTEEEDSEEEGDSDEEDSDE